MDFVRKLMNPEWLAGLGALALFCIIYAETGLFVGFFLPGDSLLVTAGVLAATNPDLLNIHTLIPLLCVAAIAGDNTGYWFGRFAGQRLHSRPDSRFFKRKHLNAAHSFYEKHGPKTVVLARFVPIVRTFGPIAAGIAEMPYRRFLPYSIGGGIFWITSMTLLGYFVGQIPLVKNHIEKVVLAVIFISLMPVFLHWLQERKKSHEEPSEPGTPTSDELKAAP